VFLGRNFRLPVQFFKQEDVSLSCSCWKPIKRHFRARNSHGQRCRISGVTTSV